MTSGMQVVAKKMGMVDIEEGLVARIVKVEPSRTEEHTSA